MIITHFSTTIWQKIIPSPIGDPCEPSDSWDRSLSPLSCILPGLYSNSKNDCVSLYFDSKYPNNVNYKNVLPEGIKGYVYKIY